MTNYEATYFFSPTLEEGAVQVLNERFSNQIVQSGGEVLKLNNHGKRRLAYQVKGQEEGYFVVLEFKGEAQTAKELGRIMRIADEVLRCIIVRAN
jgi:small subunit ribosomal protein S6